MASSLDNQMELTLSFGKFDVNGQGVCAESKESYTLRHPSELIQHAFYKRACLLKGLSRPHALRKLGFMNRRRTPMKFVQLLFAFAALSINSTAQNNPPPMKPVKVLALQGKTAHVQGIDTDGIHLWVTSVDRALRKG